MPEKNEKNKAGLSKHVMDSARRIKKEMPMVQYRQWWRDLPLHDDYVLVESQQGRTANGNMFYIVEELRRDARFDSLKIFFVVRNSTLDQVDLLFASHGIEGLSYVVIHSEEYIKLLASAKYLVTDTAFPTYYLPKEGQVIWNTWHGTPLKSMGKYDEEQLHRLGNVQKNLIMSSYLSFANDHSYKHMVDAYMIEGLCEAKVLFAGYPRNCVFFDHDRLCSVREALQDGESKRLYAYMPTWRPLRKGVPGRFRGIDLMHHLLLLDDLLEPDELMYVSIHPMERKAVDFDCLKRIRQFPEQFETYEVLGACDSLATDYSSVMFDFACTHKKIVLFLYDRKSYERHRGMVLSVDELPFPKVDTVDALMAQLRSPKSYDDGLFIDKYCKYDGKDVTRRLCETVLLEEPGCLECVDMQPSGKERVLIFVGNLAGNGITRSLTSLLSHLDTSEKDYYITYMAKAVESHKDYLKCLPEGVKYIPCMGKTHLTIRERAAKKLFKAKTMNAQTFCNEFSEMFEIKRKRLYGNIDFDTVIQFNGYDDQEILFYEQFPTKRVIYAHSDMLKEIETRGIARLDVLREAYRNYDEVAVVSKGIMPSIEKISDGKGRLCVTPNLFDYKRVVDLAEKPITFDEDTKSNVSLDKLRSFFRSGKTIISVGRFSPEKQHKMLLKAFEMVWEDCPDSHLVIVGGVSRDGMYESTCEYANELLCSDNVALVLGMSNPFSLVEKSNGFILSSAYEGFGLVLLEADALGIPVVTTDIAGPRDFVRQHGGTIVENSEKGLVEGIRLLLSGRAPCMNVDYDQYNEEAIRAFLALCD